MKRDEITALLPAVFQRTIRTGTPIAGLLEVMEAHHAPAEEVIETLDGYFDPRRCPDRFVPYLTRWVGLDWLLGAVAPAGADRPAPELRFSNGLGCLRELVAAAATLTSFRGTARGLIDFLEIATNLTGFRIEQGPQPFHFRVICPARAARYRAMLENIIKVEKPAFATFELDFDRHAGGGP